MIHDHNSLWISLGYIDLIFFFSFDQYHLQFKFLFVHLPIYIIYCFAKIQKKVFIIILFLFQSMIHSKCLDVEELLLDTRYDSLDFWFIWVKFILVFIILGWFFFNCLLIIFQGPVWCLTEYAEFLFSGSSDKTIKVIFKLRMYKVPVIRIRHHVGQLFL